MSTTAWQTTAADLVAHRSKPTCPKPPNSDPEALEEDASGEREATELRSYWRSPTEDALQRQSHVTVPSLNGDLTRRPHATQTQGSSYGTGLKKFWNRQIAMTVPHIACRDHLGKKCQLYHRPYSITYEPWHLQLASYYYWRGKHFTNPL